VIELSVESPTTSASKAELGMKILQNKVTGNQTSFLCNFGGKLSFILFFLSASTAATYIFTGPLITIITLEPSEI